MWNEREGLDVLSKILFAENEHSYNVYLNKICLDMLGTAIFHSLTDVPAAHFNNTGRVTYDIHHANK